MDQSDEYIAAVERDLESKRIEVPPGVVEQFVRKYRLLCEVGLPAIAIDSEETQRRADFWSIVTRSRKPEDSPVENFQDLLEGLGDKDWNELILFLDR